MQSYGLACAGLQMAHNVLSHLQHHIQHLVHAPACVARKLMMASSASLRNSTIRSMGFSHTCNKKSEEARHVEKTQEDIPAEPSKASPEAGNVEKTQEDAPAEPSKAVA